MQSYVYINIHCMYNTKTKTRPRPSIDRHADFTTLRTYLRHLYWGPNTPCSEGISSSCWAGSGSKLNLVVLVTHRTTGVKQLVQNRCPPKSPYPSISTVHNSLWTWGKTYQTLPSSPDWIYMNTPNHGMSPLVAQVPADVMILMCCCVLDSWLNNYVTTSLQHIWVFV